MLRMIDGEGSDILYQYGDASFRTGGFPRRNSVLDVLLAVWQYDGIASEGARRRRSCRYRVVLSKSGRFRKNGGGVVESGEVGRRKIEGKEPERWRFKEEGGMREYVLPASRLQPGQWTHPRNRTIKLTAREQ